ncbi:HER167Wp [Eremothecium sinecaudum]|uniref:Mediator of RNA polymerase II transcription subunit 9 n=1 Tax=Eremothecium sinecaudum TaxID=45286 RepID=A0A0X8HTC2_9SACH|nr:HER167Wp [Eremothecium sinecaudum]AMD21446.1 HER167Wp [Eremothecium sinecaudum]
MSETQKPNGLQNPTLNKIHNTLTKHSAQQPEFIPQIFYALHQLKEDPNNSANNLETATSSIRHRLKQCKGYLTEDPSCIELLSTTCEQGPEIVRQRQQELTAKRGVQQRLAERIKELLN